MQNSPGNSGAVNLPSLPGSAATAFLTPTLLKNFTTPDAM